MMKFLATSLTALFSLAISITTNAQVVYGHCVIQNTTLEELTCHGQAEISNTKIKGKLVINGPLTLNNVDLNTLELKGPLHTTNSTIRNKATIYGPIEATNTEFHGDIYNASNLIQLTKSIIKGDINMRAEEQQPVIDLKEHSVIYGNVAFTLKEGITKLSTDSEIKGSVNNGKKEEPKSEAKPENKPEPKQENKETKSETSTENKAKS